MSASTDEMYNASSRYLHQLFRIYFSNEPLEITKSNYLISSSCLEEAYKMSDSPFGEVTSNELSITLFNEDNIFNPLNRSSVYYNLIKKGVKVEAFIRPDEATEWDPIGVFYVTNWYTTSTGMSAEVTANDALYNVLNGPVPSLPVFRNVTLSDFLNVYFRYFGYEVTVEESVDTLIPYVYTSEHSSNKAFLTDLMKSCLADCFCDHTGKIRVVSKTSKRAIRATLSDDNQIIDINIKQSITTNYDSVSVSCNKVQESAEQSILEVSSMPIVPGANTTSLLSFSKHPVLSVRSIKTVGDYSVVAPSFKSTAKDFECNLQSSSESSVDLTVIGTVLETVLSTIGQELNAPLNIESKFIQEEYRAEIVRKYAKAYVDASMPTLELTVRGNPSIPLGSMLEISSQRFKVNYSGMLIKASYNYAGSLSCTITLIDASMLEEV